MARLEEICSLITDGSHFSPEDEGVGYPMFSVKDMTPNGFNISECKKIGEEAYKKLVANGCKPLNDDVVVAKDGSYLKTAFVIKGNPEIALLSSIAILRPKIDLVIPEYLSYFLKSDAVYRTVSLNYITGTALKRIILKGIRKIEVDLPDIGEQEQRAQRLSKVDYLCQLRKQQLAKLDELVKARFVEIFGDSVANTKNFPSTTLETVMTVFPQNGLYKPQTDYVQDDTGIPILRIDAFYNGKVTNWNTLKRLICSETEIDRYLLRENDIVINRVNSIEYLGKCAHIVGLKEKTVFESNMMRFHMDEKKVNAVYITEVLCTEGIYRQILRRAKKSVNQASINQEDVKSLEILVPPLSLQNQFAAFVERVDQQKQSVQQSLEKLELMKKALMQEYFG